MDDIIHNSTVAPSFAEITAYFNPPLQALWIDLTIFIQDTFRASPKITYSVCTGKPGWNVKYQKSGKSICTLYPEKNCLIALVVIKEEQGALLQRTQPALNPVILDLINRAKPYNHTLWLMVPVAEPDLLESLKDLLVQKQNFYNLR